MQSQIHLIAEAVSLHPLKGHLFKWIDQAEGGGSCQGGFAQPVRAIPAANDEREADLRNVAVLGYN